MNPEVIVLKYVKRLALGLLFVVALLIATGCSTTPTAWPSLAADGEAIYVALLDGKIHALNPDTGNEMWAFPNEPASQSGFPGCSGPTGSASGLFYTSPVLTKEIVFIGNDAGKVYALDKTNGTQRWPSPFTSQEETAGGGLSGFFSEKKNPAIIGSPTLDDETLYVPSADQNLYAIDVTSGAKQWEFQSGGAIWTSPLVTKDRIYLAAMDHMLYCLDKRSRAELWVFDAEGAIPSTPALAGETIYLGSLARKVFAVDADTGQQRWVFETSSWAWATPLVISDTVYVSEVDGILYALHTETGDQRWKFPQQDKIGKIQATPAYADGTLYLPSEDMNLYVLDAATGSQKWQFTASAALISTPVLVDDMLYLVGMDNKVYALDAESGAQKWVYDPTPEK